MPDDDRHTETALKDMRISDKDARHTGSIHPVTGVASLPADAPEPLDRMAAGPSFERSVTRRGFERGIPHADRLACGEEAIQFASGPSKTSIG
jgi:hypothetical protein